MMSEVQSLKGILAASNHQKYFGGLQQDLEDMPDPRASVCFCVDFGFFDIRFVSYECGLIRVDTSENILILGFLAEESEFKKKAPIVLGPDCRLPSKKLHMSSSYSVRSNHYGSEYQSWDPKKGRCLDTHTASRLINNIQPLSTPIKIIRSFLFPIESSHISLLHHLF